MNLSKRPRSYKLYVFDFDYTLFDTSEGTIHCMKAAFAGAGVSFVSDEQIRRGIGRPGNIVWGKFAEDRAIGDQIRRGIGLPLKEFFGQYVDDSPTIERMEQLFLQAAAEIMVELSVPYENTVCVVNELCARGSKLAICTGKYRDRVCRILAKHSIERNFGILVCGDELVKQKPDPEGIIRCMANFGGIGKADVAYVGDHPYDVAAAQRSGIDSIAITTGSTSRSELAECNPTYLIDDLLELL